MQNQPATTLPPQMPPAPTAPTPAGRPRQVLLTDEQWERAKYIGRGNASAGIRFLLQGDSQ